MDASLVDDAGDATFEECATHTEAASLVPVHLVFLMDQSGSMGDGLEGHDPNQRWIPVTTALKGFFDDAASAGVQASMIMFPGNLNTGTGAADQEFGEQCDSADYATPIVPLSMLPSAAFGSALDSLSPPNEWGTPTRPALAGTISYALAQRDASPDTKVVIIMVTDGEPTGCFGGVGMGNNVQSAADEAAAVADEIPVYVIGVGDSLVNLNTIAEAGGTGEALLVTVDDPAQTQAELIAAVQEIRGKEIACNMTLPVPPEGEVLDPLKVNVSFTPSSGVSTTLVYDQTCANASAWRYDDPASPTEIVLCDTTCGTVSADNAAAVNVILGCQRNDDVR